MLAQPKILVCTDFSTFSDCAIKAAWKLKEKTKGELRVLHVSEHPVLWDWLPKEGFPISLDEKVEQELLKHLHEKINNQLKRTGVSASSSISMGIPQQVILEELIAKNDDLIVMGHKGKTSGTFKIGSIAEKIVASSPRPVLIVKKEFETQKIAALVDPIESMESIINWSEELSFLLSSDLEIISFFPDIAARYIGLGKIGYSTELLSLGQDKRLAITKEIEDRIRNHLAQPEKVEIKVEVSPERKIAYQINNVVSEDKAELVVMKKHKAGFLEKVLIGSETRRMLEIYEGNLFILPS